jgi:hypothetical protein
MFGRRECEWAYGLDVKEKVLEDGPKTSKGVNCQRKQDHVLVKDVANDCVADGGDASVGLVLLFIRVSFLFVWIPS